MDHFCGISRSVSNYSGEHRPSPLWVKRGLAIQRPDRPLSVVSPVATTVLTPKRDIDRRLRETRQGLVDALMSPCLPSGATRGYMRVRPTPSNRRNDFLAGGLNILPVNKFCLLRSFRAYAVDRFPVS
jgi:hypothetical protein